MSFKYLQLAAQLQAEITRGSFLDKLPTEMELVSTYQVSRQTGKGSGNRGVTVLPLSRLMSMTISFRRSSKISNPFSPQAGTPR